MFITNIFYLTVFTKILSITVLFIKKSLSGNLLNYYPNWTRLTNIFFFISHAIRNNNIKTQRKIVNLSLLLII